jgi:hypothetical protein
MRSGPRIWLWGVIAVSALAGCKPDLGAPPSLVTSARLLAVRGQPAEAKPGTDVAFDALAVNASGTIATPALRWSLCHTPKPPAETNAVSDECLTGPDDAGPAATFTTAVPSDACMLFGPQTPPAKAGQPPIRPRDADVTGGFYQPLRVALAVDGVDPADTAFELERISCLLANAPVDVTRAYNMVRDASTPAGPCCYTANENPSLARITLDPDGAATPLLGSGASVTAGAGVTFEVGWPDGTAEEYPVWDLATRTLTTHRESLRASWFATAGTFARDSTGRGEDETDTFTRNTWTAPVDAGDVHFWVVLRDSRGGLDFKAFDLTLTP